jgi:ClpP class serine protease
VEEIARGRIWTGEEAKELGLVDELGGFETAERLLRERIGAGPDEPLRYRPFPRPRSALDLLRDRRWAVRDSPLARALAQVVEVARRAGLVGPPRGELEMPEVPGPR